MSEYLVKLVKNCNNPHLKQMEKLFQGSWYKDTDNFSSVQCLTDINTGFNSSHLLRGDSYITWYSYVGSGVSKFISQLLWGRGGQTTERTSRSLSYPLWSSQTKTKIGGQAFKHSISEGGIPDLYLTIYEWPLSSTYTVSNKSLPIPVSV